MPGALGRETQVRRLARYRPIPSVSGEGSEAPSTLLNRVGKRPTLRAASVLLRRAKAPSCRTAWFWNFNRLWCNIRIRSGAKPERPNRRPTPPRFLIEPEGGVVMDTRIYENGSRAEKLWATLIALLIGLGIVWVIGV